ncbi:MAG: hypothetical protein GQ583_03255 [Methyloprofundus sp.]|nr:hypothetical protein [Methyloprofundus sp.]
MVENNLLTCIPLGLQTLHGSQLSLVRASPEYIDFIYDCYQNDSFMDLYRLTQSRTVLKKEIQDRLKNEQTKLPQELKRIEWVILKHEKQQQTPIGLAALADHQVTHRRAEFLLGFPCTLHRVGSLGLEASLLVLEFAFNLAGLNKVTSFVYGYNLDAQRNTIHLGFKQEGFFAQHIQTESGFIDLYQNGLLRADFLNNKKLGSLARRLLKRDITQPQIPLVKPASKDLLEQLDLKLKVLPYKI